MGPTKKSVGPFFFGIADSWTNGAQTDNDALTGCCRPDHPLLVFVLASVPRRRSPPCRSWYQQAAALLESRFGWQVVPVDREACR